jgi:drug/metabolite transporter (DMT)-like permease
MSERRKAALALVAAALLWSTGGVLIKWVPWNGMAISGTRSLITAVLFWIVLRKPRFTWSVAQIGGAVTYAITVTLYISAVKMTTAANAILLQYTAPIWIALFGAWFLQERATWVDGITIAICLAGMALFFRDDLAAGAQGVAFWGNVLAALSGVSIAWMMLFLRKQKAGSPLESLLLGNVLAAAIGLPAAFGGGPLPDWRGWLVLLVLGIFQLGLAYILYTYAIRRTTALEAVLISMLEPVLNPIWVALVLGERLAGWPLVGGLLVLGASTLRGAWMAIEPGRKRQPAPIAEAEA